MKNVKILDKGVKMNQLETFDIEQKISGAGSLYRYLIENIEFVEESIGIQIQRPLNDRQFCVTATEKITERNILFFASERQFPESLGELIAFAGTFDVDIVVFFLPKTNNTCLKSLNWLQKICNEDTQFIVCKVDF